MGGMALEKAVSCSGGQNHAQFSPVSRVQLFVTPWTAAHQASLFSTISQSLLKFMSTELVMLASCLILCCPLLLLPSVFPSIGVFSNDSFLHIRWPKYSSFSFSISPSNEYTGLDEMVYRIILQYSNTYSCFIADGEFGGIFSYYHNRSTNRSIKSKQSKRASLGNILKI